jgi:drug/metabolite transporter (DMT)-like permease
MRRGLDVRLLAAVVAAVVFAASAFAAIEAGLASYSPGPLALLRMLVASAALAPYSVLSSMRLPDAKDLLAVALAGLFAFALFNVALSYGQSTASAGAASMIIASIPIFTALLAVAFLGERLDTWGWTGMALITIGEEEGFGVNAGALFLLLAAVSASFYFAFQKPYLKKYGSLVFTAYVIWAGALLLLPFLSGLIEEVRSAPPRATLAVVVLVNRRRSAAPAKDECSGD